MMAGTQWQLLIAACLLTIRPAIIVVAISQRQLAAAIGAGDFGGRKSLPLSTSVPFEESPICLNRCVPWGSRPYPNPST